MVECEDYADGVTAERVRRVINGVPDARDESLREGLGGSFTYCELGPPIELEGMLTGDALPSYSALAAYLLHTASGISAGQVELTPRNEASARRISAASRGSGRKAVVFGPGKYIGQRDLTPMGITFCLLPYEMHRSGQ